MIPDLCKYINSSKTEAQCQGKIQTMLSGKKTYGQFVNALKLSTKVNDTWIS